MNNANYTTLFIHVYGSVVLCFMNMNILYSTCASNCEQLSLFYWLLYIHTSHFTRNPSLAGVQAETVVS